jgi:hypothetical protein
VVRELKLDYKPGCLNQLEFFLCFNFFLSLANQEELSINEQFICVGWPRSAVLISRLKNTVGVFIVREKYCSGWKNKLKSTDYKPNEQDRCCFAKLWPSWRPGWRCTHFEPINRLRNGHTPNAGLRSPADSEAEQPGGAASCGLAPASTAGVPISGSRRCPLVALRSPLTRFTVRTHAPPVRSPPVLLIQKFWRLAIPRVVE